MKKTLTLLVENHQGVLSRIARLFDGRDYRLERLSLQKGEEEGISRMTLVIDGSKPQLEKVEKQLEKLIDVIQLEAEPELVPA